MLDQSNIILPCCLRNLCFSQRSSFTACHDVRVVPPMVVPSLLVLSEPYLLIGTIISILSTQQNNGDKDEYGGVVSKGCT